MKQTFFLVGCILVMISCKKSDTPEPTPDPILPPITITKVDFSSNFKPAGTFKTADINLTSSPLAVPIAGEKQVWTIHNLATVNPLTKGPYITPSNAAFATATYGINRTSTFGFGSLSSSGTPSTQYLEVNDAGWFSLGNTTSATDVLNIPSIGGTLTYAPQSIANTPKFPILNLPASYGNITKTGGILSTVSFIANAPAAGVNNTPGQVKTSDSVVNNIIASGTISLSNLGTPRVLVNKQTVYTKTNYFLGGAPAPAALLNTLGLTDGAVTTTVNYDFYAEVWGWVGTITSNAAGTAVVSATFRTQ
jgi:hypothetical protein